MTSKTNDNSVEINFEKSYNNYSIGIEQFDEYQIFCDKLKKLNSEYFKLIKSE